MKTSRMSTELDTKRAQRYTSHGERVRDPQREVATLIPIEAGKSQGLYRDVELLLEEQITTDPKDPRPLLKLIELYFEGRNKEDFLRAAKNFNKKFSRDSNKTDWQDVISMGVRLLPNEQLFKSMADGFQFDVGNIDNKGVAKMRLGEQPKYEGFFAELAEAYEAQRKDKTYVKELDSELQHTLNRPVSMMHAKQMSQRMGGAQIFLKREDLSPPMTHLNIALTGQAVLAKRMGKTCLVTASNNGFRGVMMASIARRMGMEALVFVDENAIDELPGNMRRLELMGAEVHAINPDTLDESDLRTEALEYCLRTSDTSFLAMGLDAAPHPYPQILMESEAVIGRETLLQIYAETKKLPSLLVARGGNNADAIGLFTPFLSLKTTALASVSPIAEMVNPLSQSSVQGPESEYLINRAVAELKQRTANRILEGLEYPSVGREQAWLKASGRLTYPEITSDQVRQAVRDFSMHEGLIPAIETAHALAYACEAASRMKAEESVVVMIAERVDKDLPQLEMLMAKGMI